MMRRALLGLALATVVWPAQAQDYPTRPIRVIATSSAGGTSDVFMRALADELRATSGRTVPSRSRSSRKPDCSRNDRPPVEPLAYNQFL
jgi:tripartite-type tricarboxylate transporter receptor subunit TctC